MKNKFTIVLITLFVLVLTGCASIVSKSSYPISINSSPSEAKISITNKKGIEIFNGNTPATLKLQAGSGFFGKEQYQVKFSKDGYETKTVPINFKLDGWYFGNILFGGVIGMLIIDPATGAMYKLDTEFLNETLLAKSNDSKDTTEINIYSIDEIPTEWTYHLEMIYR